MKYPKLTLLFIICVLTIFLARGENFLFLQNFLEKIGLWGAFLAGIFYAYGFTAPPATAALIIIAKQQDIVLAGLIAATGAFLGDMMIFKFVRHTFKKEAERLAEEKFIRHFHRLPRWLKKHLALIVGSILVASPLSDEIGVSILALSEINIKNFSMLSIILNTLGIFIILLIGRAV
jgi:uncharacterized membrane protein YdjX (TVP38/TMEM64 family)